MPTTYNFKPGVFSEGDDNRFYMTLTDPDTGDYYDWAGVTKAWITIKKSVHDDDTDAKLQLDSVNNVDQLKIDHPTADEGQFWVWIKAADCKTWGALGTLRYDFQVLKDGLENTLVEGAIPFGHECTQATS